MGVDVAIKNGSHQKERFVKCTQAEFDRLPAIVSRAEFLDWTGLSENELDDDVKQFRESNGAHGIPVYRSKENGYAGYYKHVIARMGNWKM